MENELSDICSDRNPDPANQRERIIMALARGADVHAVDKNGVTALHHAVRFRSPAAVKILIERGAKVDQPCRRNGSTPLHRAVTQTGAPGTAGKAQDAREIIEILLAAGADPSIKNKLGKTAADYVTDKAIKAMLSQRRHPPRAVEFNFHAEFVDANVACRRLNFAETIDASGEHYFVMERSEESPEEIVPDSENIYIERDDQGWGGYGGIKRVVLARDSLTIYLSKRMAKQMGRYESIRVSFSIPPRKFQKVQRVLGLIMRGYESLMETPV